MNLAARAVLILLLATPASGFAPEGAPVVSLESDLDGDGLRERISLYKGGDPALIVSRGNRVLWKGVPARWKPWKLMIADVDGDGHREIVVGVYKATRFFPKPHNCLFVYAWDGRRAQPKWLGSSLSRPFVDFAFIDTDGDREEELAAIERKRDGRFCLALYSWNGFGFTLDWQQGDWRKAELIKAGRDGITVEADGAPLKFKSEEMKNKS